MPDQTQEPQQTPEQIAQESDAAFASGFNEERGIESAPPAKPVDTKTVEAPKTEEAAAPNATATPKAEAPKPVDDYANLPPSVKAEMDSMRTSLRALEALPAQLRTIHGHIGGLTAATKELKTALATAKTVAEAKGADTPTQQQVEDAQKSDERWKQLRSDFPDWAEAVDDRLAKLQAAIPKATPPVDTAALTTAITTDINKSVAQQISDAETRARVHAYLDLKHEGWDAKISTPEFEAWYAKQPKEVQALSASANRLDASKMIGLFDAHLAKGVEKSDRDKRLESAITPSGVVVTAAGEDPEAAFNEGFNEVRAGG